MLTVLKKIADVGTFSAKPFDKIYTENSFSANEFFREKSLNENSWSEDKGGLISEMLSLNLAQISKKRCQITNLSWALSTLWKSSFWLRIVIWHNPFEIWAKAKNFLRLGHLLNAVGYRIMKP